MVSRNIKKLIVSITKFWIVIGSPMPICHIIGTQSCGCPITGIVIYGHLICHLHVNYICFNGFFLNVSLLSQVVKCMENADISAQKKFSEFNHDQDFKSALC